jgi:hypothetical protein
MTISDTTMDEDKNDLGTTETTTTTAMETTIATAPTVEKEEVSAEASEKNQHRHIFDMRIEFSTSAHTAVDTFSIVPAIKGFTHQLLATNVVFILSRSGKQFFSTMSDFPKTAEAFDEFFETDQQNLAKISKVWSRIRASSTIPFWQLKKHGLLHGYIRQHGLYVNEHGFKTLPITDIGVILFRSPEFTYRQDFTKALRRHILLYFSALTDTEIKKLSNGINELDLESNTLPLFEVTAKKNVKFNFRQSDETGQQTTKVESTIGMKILCETQERQRLSFLLTEASRHSKYVSGLFLGYAEKNQSPDQCRQALRANNVFLNTLLRIAVSELHPILLDSQRIHGTFDPALDDPNNIPTVRESILALPGTLTTDPTVPLFYSIDATPITEEKGTFNFMTHKEQEANAISFIDNQLHKWCQETREFTTHGEKFSRGAQRRTPRQFNQQALFAAVETTLNSAPADQQLHAQAIAPPARNRYQRRQLNIWKDPAAFNDEPTPTAATPSPWLGNKNWQTVGKNVTPTQKQHQTTKTGPSTTAGTTATQGNNQLDLARMKKELDHMKTMMTSHTKTTNSTEELDTMRTQITAEVRASFPDTTSNTFATQLTEQVEKAVQKSTDKLQKEMARTNQTIEGQTTTMKDFEKQVDEKINNLALKTVTLTAKTKEIATRLTEIEDNTAKRFNALRLSVDGNSKAIADLSSITSENNVAVEDNTKQLSALISAMYDQNQTRARQEKEKEQASKQPIELDTDVVDMDTSFDSALMETIDFAVEGAKASPRRPATKRQGDPLTTQEE